MRASFLAAPYAVPQRAVEGVGQDEEPGERGGAAGARGGMAQDPPTVIRSMNRQHRRDAPRPDARPVASRLRIRLYVDENFP